MPSLPVPFSADQGQRPTGPLARESRPRAGYYWCQRARRLGNVGAPSSGKGPGCGRDQEGEGFSWVPHPGELRYEGNSVTLKSPRALVTEQGNQISNLDPCPWRAAPLHPQPQTLRLFTPSIWSLRPAHCLLCYPLPGGKQLGGKETSLSPEGRMTLRLVDIWNTVFSQCSGACVG